MRGATTARHASTGLCLVLLVVAVLSLDTRLAGQRADGPAPAGGQGGAAQPGRQGGAQPGRQGGTPVTGARGGAAQPARDRPATAGTAVIRGRVVAADTGVPVRRAQVQASSGGGRGRGALTDSEGNFELRDLPAGSWTLRASKAGFVAQQFGQRSPFAPSPPVVLADRQELIANFGLSRGGVVTGRVYDDFGDPVANARVAALRVEWTPNGRRLVATGASVPTDDMGSYRVYGLAPGAYYIGVSSAGGGSNASLVTSEGPVTYSTVYFPGTADVGAAERIVVTAGQEQSGANVSFTPVRAARITGVVLGSSGLPIRATVRLQMQMFSEGPPAAQTSANTATDGTFTLANVPPGTYTLDVSGRNTSSGAPAEVASIPVSVGPGGLSGLIIATTRGATISGTIAGDNTAGRLQPSSIRVTAPPMRSTQRGATPRAQATATGAFELSGLIGLHSLRFEQLPAGWAVKSVTANGVDVADVPLDFRGTEHVSVRVVLTDRIAEVAGTVRSDRPLRGTSVLVFPDDETKWSAVSRYLRTARPADDGQFTVRGLPSGTRYLVVALDYLDAGEHLDPDFLRRVKPFAATFSLGEGEQKSIELPLVARQ